MKTILKTAMIASLVCGAPILAQENSFNVSGSAALTTNYMWRGISYTDETATGQAGVDFNNVANMSGLHVNLWGSGISQGSEIDAILGYTNEVNKNFAYDAGYIYYYYTLAGSSYGEFFLSTTLAENYGLTVYVEDGALDTHNVTVEASAAFGPVEAVVGTYIAEDSDASNSYASIGVNWACMMDKSYNMNASLAYNSGYEASQAFLGAQGATFALTLSKGF